MVARYDDTITVPRAVRLPVELVPPDGFDPGLVETWPAVAGRLEYLDGRLLYMPPCGDVQQDTVTDVVITLGSWIRTTPGFLLGTNEAGMRIGGATRAADAAVWRSSEASVRTGGLRRTPPLLAVEVAGLGEDEAALRNKARWYLDVGVEVVWLVLPATREVVVLTRDSDTRHGSGARLPPSAALPGLLPGVDEMFVQLG